MYPDKSPFSKEASSTRFILTHLLPTCLRAASKCGINVIDFVRHVGVSPLTLVPGHGDLPVKELFRLLNEGTLIGWQATPGGHVPVLVAECFQFDYLSDATGYLSSSPNLIAASRLFELVSHLLCPPARLEHHMNQDVVTMVLVYEEEFGDPSVTWSASEATLEHLQFIVSLRVDVDPDTLQVIKVQLLRRPGQFRQGPAEQMPRNQEEQYPEAHYVDDRADEEQRGTEFQLVDDDILAGINGDDANLESGVLSLIAHLERLPEKTRGRNGSFRTHA